MEYCGKYDLKNHSTLKIGPVNAKVVYIDKKEDIEQSLDMAKKLGFKPYPLGGGSNTIFSDEVVDKYLFLIPRMSSLSVIPDPVCHSRGGGNPVLRSEFMDPRIRKDDNSDYVIIKIDAGLEWDKAVEQTVEMGLSGLEALSWIPGLVGASPVQNIGAYGSEAKDTIQTVHTYDFQEKGFKVFNNAECEFEYRNSIFKKNPGRYFIYAVTFSLSTKARPSVPQYKEVILYFKSKKINSPNLREIREAIIEIRKVKLPDPKETPNAGSYFGNPIISKETAGALLQKFPAMPMFDFGTNKKLFAGWLIDKAGLKGYKKDNFSIHKNHALVIIGNRKGTFDELFKFENYIKQKVFEMFGVTLEREPVVIK